MNDCYCVLLRSSRDERRALTQNGILIVYVACCSMPAGPLPHLPPSPLNSQEQALPAPTLPCPILPSTHCQPLAHSDCALTLKLMLHIFSFSVYSSSFVVLCCVSVCALKHPTTPYCTRTVASSAHHTPTLRCTCRVYHME